MNFINPTETYSLPNDDFRKNGLFTFYNLYSLCQLAKTTIEMAEAVFVADDFITAQALPRMYIMMTGVEYIFYFLERRSLLMQVAEASKGSPRFIATFTHVDSHQWETNVEINFCQNTLSCSPLCIFGKNSAAQCCLSEGDMIFNVQICAMLMMRHDVEEQIRHS